MAASQTRAARFLIAQLDDYEKGDPMDYISEPMPVLDEAKAAGIIKYNKKGDQCRFKVVTDRGSVTAMSADATSTFTATNPGIEVVFGNRGYKTTDQISEIDTEVAAGASEIFDLQANRVLWMPEHITRGMETEVYTGDGSTDAGFGANGLVGWNSTIITSGNFGGQSTTTHTALAGQVLSAGVHATFSTDPFPSLRAMIHACVRGKDAGRGVNWPTHVFMDVDNMGYVLNASNDLRMDQSHSAKREYGVEDITFMKAKLVMDRYAPANRCYVINMKTQELQTPFRSLIQSRRKKELSPLSEQFLTFFFGRWINRNPRANARVTTS